MTDETKPEPKNAVQLAKEVIRLSNRLAALSEKVKECEAELTAAKESAAKGIATA